MITNSLSFISSSLVLLISLEFSLLFELYCVLASRTWLDLDRMWSRKNKYLAHANLKGCSLREIVPNNNGRASKKARQKEAKIETQD